MLEYRPGYTMKADRIAVVALVLLCWSVLNFLPNNFPHRDTYGSGFPMKWESDPGYKHAVVRSSRAYGPRDQWRFDPVALAVNVGLGVVVLGAALGCNELWQKARGNRWTAPEHPG
jgi:hypothetical protein